MTGIVSQGIGSGLDVSGLVNQLVAAEGQPAQQRLVVKETQFQGRLSAYGSLKSALESFKSSIEKLDTDESLASRTITVSNEEAATATVEASAAPASYTIDIVGQAQAARLTSGAFATAQSTVGTGTLTLTVGDASFDVTVADDANTLADVRDAINNADDNTGVQASIINAEGGSYLVLSGENTGASNTIAISQADGDGGLASLVYDPAAPSNPLTLSQVATDAEATVNGFTVFSATNTFDAVIDGVSFTALQETDGDTFTLAVANDTASVSSAVFAFVNAYNSLADITANLSSFDPDSQIAGPLQGDSALRTVSNALRRELSENTSTANPLFDTLSEIGISLDEDGQLQVDSEVLDGVLEDDFRAIGELFGGESGYGARLTTVIDAYVDSDGILTSRTEGLESNIEALEGEREALAERLERLETRLLRQFNGLDSLLSQLNLTSNFLATQLANIPTPGGNNN